MISCLITCIINVVSILTTFIPSNFTVVNIEAPLGHGSNASLGLFRLVKVQVVHIGGLISHLVVSDDTVSLQGVENNGVISSQVLALLIDITWRLL